MNWVLRHVLGLIRGKPRPFCMGVGSFESPQSQLSVDASPISNGAPCSGAAQALPESQLSKNERISLGEGHFLLRLFSCCTLVAIVRAAHRSNRLSCSCTPALVRHFSAHALLHFHKNRSLKRSVPTAKSCAVPVRMLHAANVQLNVV